LRGAPLVRFARVASSSGQEREVKVKIVVIGGTGLIGAKTAARLRDRGHDVIATSASAGTDTERLADALVSSQVTVDLGSSPSLEPGSVLELPERSGRDVVAMAAIAGVRHHVALSFVGADRLVDSGYFRAQMAQENAIKGAGIPYTIVQSTQLFELMSTIAALGTIGEMVRLPPAAVQPIASDDVADAIADIALGTPVNGTIQIAGPDRLRLNQLVGRFLSATRDPRDVVTDTQALYFGVKLNDRSLIPGDNPRIGAVHFEDWLSEASSSH
jgi:uncharacterized protein YbjT (DUF2867 family)